ncbi:MAG: RNA polymerase sigma factor [Ignavibacteriaceae bacterium]|nr:RNA polymerase sigma factor [Ignavibacterium sp.]MCC6256227.1 RNA polymerase sigma factor [Ignavibacteriaceae bacterium]HMN25587.1 RNA polymerase sigma factor [Ignavibacteriaceae bacterium]HRN27796.1 RNA polymerase sigma factor [Ignavibacteriaceae bacterium]HRP91394.1 RNA polymerase sigma factor [Ignavibacteriaceae bacterium]
MQAEENKIIEFTLLFSKHKRRVYNYALKMLGDKMHADDVVQDVFIKLFEHLNTIQNKQSVQFWLFKTARNEILSFYRSTKNKKLITNSVDMNEIEIESPLLLADEIENKELSKLILTELDLMNEDFKEVFVLKEYSGLSYKEIASLLDIDDELVKSRLYKARQKLVNKISKLIE